MIGILDYGMGNISSVNNSLTYLGFDTKVIQESIELNNKITHLIVPGVGSYSKAMQNLKNRQKNKQSNAKRAITNGLELAKSRVLKRAKTKVL